MAHTESGTPAHKRSKVKTPKSVRSRLSRAALKNKALKKYRNNRTKVDLTPYKKVEEQNVWILARSKEQIAFYEAGFGDPRPLAVIVPVPPESDATGQTYDYWRRLSRRAIFAANADLELVLNYSAFVKEFGTMPFPLARLERVKGVLKWNKDTAKWGR